MAEIRDTQVIKSAEWDKAEIRDTQVMKSAEWTLARLEVIQVIKMIEWEEGEFPLSGAQLITCM